jgi:hypothetical protein
VDGNKNIGVSMAQKQWIDVSYYTIMAYNTQFLAVEFNNWTRGDSRPRGFARFDMAAACFCLIIARRALGSGLVYVVLY